MSVAHQTRKLVEAALAHKNPTALSPTERAVRRLIPSGIDSVDAILKGGLPIGTITEFVGTNGSGRTTAALAYVAAITRAGNVCAWVDAADSLDPESTAANGVDLERLLWVRCGAKQATVSQTSSESVKDALCTSSAITQLPRHTGGGSPHPRSEGRDMPQAISAMLHAHSGLYDKQARRVKKAIGTPGAPNRPLTHRSEERDEQVNSDRLPPRRGENLALPPRCAEPQPKRVPQVPSNERLPVVTSRRRLIHNAGKPWQALDQALRATDLLLQGGGFNTIVLDLGSVQPEAVWRIPLATWFRFRAACERSRTNLLLLTQHSCARSSAELVVRLETGCLEADGKVITGIRYRGEAERNRAQRNEERVIPIRKPPQPERSGQWVSGAAWAQAK